MGIQNVGKFCNQHSFHLFKLHKRTEPVTGISHINIMHANKYIREYTYTIYGNFSYPLDTLLKITPEMVATFQQKPTPKSQ